MFNEHIGSVLMPTHSQIVKALEDLGANEWSLSGDEIAGIVWLTGVKKTEGEIKTAIANPLPEKVPTPEEKLFAATGLSVAECKALGL